MRKHLSRTSSLWLVAMAFVIVNTCKAQGKFGISVISEYSPMDMTKYWDVLNGENGLPVLTTASAFVKLGIGFEGKWNNYLFNLNVNNIFSGSMNAADTAYSYSNARLELNVGYEVLGFDFVKVYPYVGLSWLDVSYQIDYDGSYTSLGQYINSTISKKKIGYNLGNANAGIRVDFKQIEFATKEAIGFSLRAGTLIPFGIGRFSVDGSQIKPNSRLIDQQFYLSLICTCYVW